MKKIQLASLTRRPNDKTMRSLKAQFIKLLNKDLERAAQSPRTFTYQEYDSKRHEYQLQLLINNSTSIMALKRLSLKMNMISDSNMDYQAVFLTAAFRDHKLVVDWNDKVADKGYVVNPESIRVNFDDPRHFNPKVSAGISFKVDFCVVRPDKK